jgi:hypothetical protein
MNTKAIAILEVVSNPLGTTIQSLGAGKTLTIRTKGPSSVYCMQGSLWITREGDPTDLIVKAGETRSIDGVGRIVISAFENSKLWVA